MTLRSPMVAYGMSAAALMGAVLLRWLLDPLLGDSLPLVTLFGAVAAAVWLGGYRPALFVVVLGYLACFFLFIEPRGAFGLNQGRHLTGLFAYLFTCSLIVGFGEALRRTQGRSELREESLRTTLASIGDAVIATDTKGLITIMNVVAESLTGWSSGEASGRPFGSVFRIVDEHTRQPIDSLVETVLKKSQAVAVASDNVLIARDGAEHLIDNTAAPIRRADGEVVGCVLVFRDITGRRRLERQNVEREAAARFLASIVESSEDAIISKSLDGIIRSWNAAAQRLFGYAPEHAIGRPITLIIPADRAEEENRILASLRSGRRVDHFDTVRLRSDGRPVHVSLTISPIRDASGRVTGASKIARDITERKRAEEALQTSEERFRMLADNMSQLAWTCDRRGNISWYNQRWYDYTGMPLDEMREWGWKGIQHPEHVEHVLESIRRSREIGEIWENTFPLRGRDGTYRWFLSRARPFRDGAGQIVRWFGTNTDVTALRDAEQALVEADRRKDEFLAMLAHELRNPLASIRYATQVLQLAGNEGGSTRSVLEMLQRQVGQLMRLVDDLLDVNRITRGQIELRKERVELAHILHQAAEAVRPLIDAKQHGLTVTVPPEPIHLNADPARLSQVVGNLLSNACKFMDDGGRVALSAARDGKHAVIRVRDEGIGIAPDQLPGIFDMFAQLDVSLERSISGVGIGLALVKNLTELHGGTIQVRSEGRGRGSEFVVRLPVDVGAQECAPGPIASEARPLDGHRILIVDDNQDSAELLSTLLTLGGHQTHTVHDGFEAVEAVERFRANVVLLDIGLPSLNGYEVCRRIRAQPGGKDIVVVAVTGWGQEEDRQRSRAAGFDTHVVKPVDSEALMRLLGSLAH